MIKEASELESFDSTRCLGHCNPLEIGDCSELLGFDRAAIAPETTHFSKTVERVFELCLKGAGTFHSASQIKEGSVGFGTSQHPIFMKLLPDHLWH